MAVAQAPDAPVGSHSVAGAASDRVSEEGWKFPWGVGQEARP
jgi:hypothetical protein